MSTLGNILWFILGGFLVALMYFVSGLLMCITIIGIPFGLQLMKIGALETDEDELYAIRTYNEIIQTP